MVDLDSLVDPRFGPAANFVIYDTETEEAKAYANPGSNASGGAGVQAAQFIASHGAQAAISDDFAPNAYNTLGAAGTQSWPSSSRPGGLRWERLHLAQRGRC